MEKKQIKSRRYCFTIFHYTEEELERLHVLAALLEHHCYISYGLEIAETTGAPHIQGYIELKSAQRIAYVQKYINFTRNGKLLKFHVEKANGDVKSNEEYTQKDGKFWVFGEPLKQGSRTDMSEIKEAIKANPKDLKNIIDEHANNYQQLRFAQNLQAFYFEPRTPENPPKVFWIYGATGVGKSTLVYRNFNDLCSVSDGKWPGTGYQQQECLLFDDFREDTIPFSQLLKIADRFPFDLQFKGGFVPLNSPYIVFTSPYDIDQAFTWTRENLEQLKRRVVEIYIDSVETSNSIDLRNYPNNG
jgi:hypothetical protein